jgi:proline iminopeptidase
MDAIEVAAEDFGLSENIRASLRQVFAQYPAIDKVLVYGSRGRGDFQAHSDIDLAILAPKMTDREFSSLWNALDDLPILFRLDVVHWDRATNAALKENIIADGVALHHAAQTLTSSPDPSPRAPPP